MTDYKMPVLTEQERKHAIYDAEERIHAFKSYCKLNPGEKHAEDELLLLQIALAALTAKPAAYEVKGIFCHTLEEAEIYVGEPEPLYDAPPVPVKQEGEHRD